MEGVTGIALRAMKELLELGHKDFAIVINVQDGAVGYQTAFATTDDAMSRVDTYDYERIKVVKMTPNDEAEVSD